MNPIKLFIVTLSYILLFSCKGEKVEPTATVSKVETSETKQKQSTAYNGKSSDHLDTGGMKWMTIEQMNEIRPSGSKKYLIDIYTEWCGWCKVMDKKTFSDPAVQKLLGSDYHLVKFDAEDKNPIVFNGITYEWQAGGRRGNNALAVELLKGKMSYPSLVYLDKDLNVIKISSGYKNPEQMIQELEIIEKS